MGIPPPLIGRTYEHAGNKALGATKGGNMYTRLRRFAVRVTAAMATCVLTAATANALIIVTPKPDQPVNNAALQLTAQTVHADLTDRAAEVSVEFTYHNSSRFILEGTYLFPLPPEAAVDNFSLYVDGEEIHAELLDVQQARRTYESIVRQIKDPALLEYVDRQLLKARIFPIQPNSDAKVKLYYTHPLVADFGTTDFVFPFSIEQRARNASVSLTAEIITTSPIKSATSPTHDIDVAYDGLNHVTVTTPSGWGGADTDFHLLCTYDTRDLGAQFLTAVNEDGEHYFMGIIAPGEADQESILPKDVVFCFDRSGSMAGEKIEQARNALKFCLRRLNADDRFGLLVFNDGIRAYADEMRSATDVEITNASDFVSQVDADGGTFIDGAMQRSLEMFAAGNRPKYLVFLTDGLPTVGERNAAIIVANARTRNRNAARIFTFGVGHDLNAGLLNDLADAGDGLSSYVDPGEDVEVKVSNFFRKISRPVLTDCRLKFEGDVDITEVYPSELPDVYAGSEIVVVGRYNGEGTLTARLLGSRGAESLNHTFASDLHPKRGRYEFIPKLWAGRRIGHLLEDMRKNGETGEVKDEVIRLSKQYGIMTPYTAFLAAPEKVRLAALSGQPNLRAPQQGNSLPSIQITRERQLIQTDQATTKRDVTAAKIKSLPVDNVADILKTQTGIKIHNDQFHVRGGRAEGLLYTIDSVTPGDLATDRSRATTRKNISASRMSNAPSVQALGTPMPVPDEDATYAAGDAPPSVSIGGKQFTLLNGIWTDWALIGNPTPPADTIAVKPYSDAYFQLSKIPEIARILTVGNPVMFLWRNVIIKIDENGNESWNRAWDKSL